MALTDKATVLEQSYNMYPLAIAQNNYYWKDWAEAFIQQCLNLGWEVEIGPGTSLGAIIAGAWYGTSYSGQAYYRVSPEKSSGWDCDWTQVDGIAARWQEDDTYNNFPKYTGWFKDFDIWPAGANEHGIDESTGRFDFIIYTGTGNSGEKIGFRIKYPICSIGYSYHHSPLSGNEININYIYGVPAITLYSSSKKDIDNFYPVTMPTNEYTHNTYVNDFSGYVSFFGKEEYGRPSYNSLIVWQKTDENNTQYQNQTYTADEIATSPLWSLELQTSKDFTICPVETMSQQTQRLYRETWYKYNKFHYHVSQTGDTVYMYVSNSDGQVGLKLIATTLDSGEKAIMIEHRQILDDNILCEMAAVTGSENNNPSQPVDNYLIKMPMRPYVKHTSGTGKFSFSRMLIPTQLSFCKDLYYVTKRDINESIGDGQYVWVKDKNSIKHCFRIIPFGSRTTKEVNGDNTTYLAFPVVDPPEEED